MIEAAAAAGVVVAYVAPALTEIAKGAAVRIGELADDSVFKWLRQKLTGRAAQAFTDLETKPESGPRQALLKEELEDLFKQNPALLAELAPLLPSQPATTYTSTQNAQGPDAIAASNQGTGNSITIR